MNRAKLCGFAIISMLGLSSLSPIAAMAADTNSESETISEANKDQKEKRGAFDKKLKEAEDKWNSLSAKQKDEVYAIMKDEMDVENKLMDKLVELGVFSKEDAASLKAFMEERYNRVKKSGEFPFSRKKGR